MADAPSPQAPPASGRGRKNGALFTVRREEAESLTPTPSGRGRGRAGTAVPLCDGASIRDLPEAGRTSDRRTAQPQSPTGLAVMRW